MIRHAVVSSSLLFFMVGAMEAVNADTISPNSLEMTLPVEAQNKVIGVRLDDVVANFPQLVPGLANVAAQMNKKPEVFFYAAPLEKLHVAYLSEIPDLTAPTMELKIVGFVKNKLGSRFERIVVRYNKGAKKLDEMAVEIQSVLDVKNTNFVLTVGLIDRKLILEDEQNDLKMIFPIGVGGFDEGVLNEGKVSLLTPRFKNGVVDQRAVISKRDKPRYFDGKPFIRILQGSDIRKDVTAIGFHIEINDSFVRGFDSHGCMRLREFDLFALHDLIMDGSKQQLPITVAYKCEDKADHPAGRRNKSFKTVLNNGTAEIPFFPLDRDNLVQMTYKDTGAPVEKLIDMPGDNNEEMYNYDTQSQLREQDERRKNQCDAKVMSGEILATDKKAMEKCLNEGKREDSVKDRLYRKLMGIDSADGPIFF